MWEQKEPTPTSEWRGQCSCSVTELSVSITKIQRRRRCLRRKLFQSQKLRTDACLRDWRTFRNHVLEWWAKTKVLLEPEVCHMTLIRRRSLLILVEGKFTITRPQKIISRNPKITKQASNRSTSLSRAGTGASLKPAKSRLSLDPKMSRPPTMSQSMREGRTSTAKV